MTEEETIKETAEEPLSKEEIAKRRAEITKFYKDQITHLKVQAQYEELLTQIEENRAKRLQAQMFLAQAYEQGEANSEDVEKAKDQFEESMSGRTLKRKV